MKNAKCEMRNEEENEKCGMGNAKNLKGRYKCGFGYSNEKNLQEYNLI